MKNKKKLIKGIILLAIGIPAAIIGILVIKGEDLKTLSGLFIGIGAACTALGIGDIISSFIISAARDEEISRIEKIEVNDERNVQIKDKAGNMTLKVINMALCLLVIAFGIMKIDRIVIIVLACVLILELLLIIAFSEYYSRKI